MKNKLATYNQKKTGSGRIPRLMIGLGALTLSLGSSQAEITSYTSRSAFEAAVSQPLFTLATEDFENFASDADLFAPAFHLPRVGLSLQGTATTYNTARHLIDVPPYRFGGGGVEINGPQLNGGSFVWSQVNMEDDVTLRLTSLDGFGPSAHHAIGFDYSGATGAILAGVDLIAACRVTTEVVTEDGTELIETIVDFPPGSQGDDGFIGFHDPESRIVSIEIYDRGGIVNDDNKRRGERMAIDNLVASLPDTDGDGMHDQLEDLYGLDKAQDDAGMDPDEDGLDNLTELRRQTDPHNADTDGDGVPDGVESETGVLVGPGDSGTNPREADSDFDGLADASEISRGTDPNDADSDGDGFLDGFEVAQGSDPSNASSVPNGFAQGLISYWPADGDTRDAVNDNHASPWEGAVPFVEGKFGEAISITKDPTRCYIDHGDESEFDFPGQSMSVSVWFKHRPGLGRNEVRTLVGKGPRGAWRLQLVDPNSANGYLRFTAGFTITENAGVVVNDGQWHHAVAVAEEGVATRLYVDGVLVATGAAPNMEDGALRLHIGANPDDGMYAWWQRWHGDIDDVAVWGRPLPEDEISSIWNGGTGASIGELLVPAPLEISEFNVDLAGGEFSLTWRSGIGKSYAIDFSTDMVSWNEATDSVNSQGEFTTHTGDLRAPSGAQRLYFRVREEPR